MQRDFESVFEKGKSDYLKKYEEDKNQIKKEVDDLYHKITDWFLKEDKKQEERIENQINYFQELNLQKEEAIKQIGVDIVNLENFKDKIESIKLQDKKDDEEIKLKELNELIKETKEELAKEKKELNETIKQENNLDKVYGTTKTSNKDTLVYKSDDLTKKIKKEIETKNKLKKFAIIQNDILIFEYNSQKKQFIYKCDATYNKKKYKEIVLNERPQVLETRIKIIAKFRSFYVDEENKTIYAECETLHTI
ncbi:hypothetical protein M0811_12349 [Anaeramoeba ignava]|uniref:Uncharacterized protein n=1 Tax=Anaeramoeba ignava TaxID=1746090 RepID=A0A9Q0R6I8_ANAIG|nr:hypothetical protein M0811_12349 [Anaeramoeba ignava]